MHLLRLGLLTNIFLVFPMTYQRDFFYVILIDYFSRLKFTLHDRKKFFEANFKWIQLVLKEIKLKGSFKNEISMIQT